VRITVSSPTRFHLFDLGRELNRRGHNVTLFSALTSSYVPGELRSSARCAPWLGALVAGSRLIPEGMLRRSLDWQQITRFDRWVARHLPPSDVAVALSGRGLRTLERAKELGGRAVCDRGSAHIEFQDNILSEEYARWGFEYPSIDPRGIARELHEYEIADLITVPSTFCAETFIARGVLSSKVAVTPYGVDLDSFHPRTKEEGSSPFRILFAGRVSLRKGVPYLLAAFRELRRAHPSIELWIAGVVEREVAQILHAQPSPVVMLGHLPRERLMETYRDASVLVLPSLEEGLATVMGQAMASGLPVIATPNSGAPDLITDGTEGFIVPIRSSDAIRERVDQLIEDPASREDMGRRARARVERAGGWSAYAAAAELAYSRIDPV